MNPRPLVPEDIRPGVLQAAERRSLHRVLAASVLAKATRKFERDVLRTAWPGDNHAAQLQRAISNPTSTTDGAVVSPSPKRRSNTARGLVSYGSGVVGERHDSVLL